MKAALYRGVRRIEVEEVALPAPGPGSLLVEMVRCGSRAVRQCGEDGRGTVLVTGSGTIGLLAVAAAKAFGSGVVIATARHDHQAAMSSLLGADRVLRPTGPGPSGEDAEAVRALTDSQGADAVIETTASAGGLADALASVRKGGVIVVVGGYHSPVEVDLKRVIDNEIRLFGSFCYGFSGMKRDFQWSMDLIASKKVPAQRLVTHRFPLDRIAGAFEAAADKETRSIKVHICPAGQA